jgi:hypothetical protein
VPAASKEWVIQPKSKPGRKPKTDLAVKDDSEVCLCMNVQFSWNSYYVAARCKGSACTEQVGESSSGETVLTAA